MFLEYKVITTIYKHSILIGDQAHDCNIIVKQMDSNNETTEEKIKKNASIKIVSQQSSQEQETAVQKLDTKDAQLNDKLTLAKNSFNKLLDNKTQFKTLNVSREESVTSSGVESVSQNHLNIENGNYMIYFCNAYAFSWKSLAIPLHQDVVSKKEGHREEKMGQPLPDCNYNQRNMRTELRC